MAHSTDADTKILLPVAASGHAAVPLTGLAGQEVDDDGDSSVPVKPDCQGKWMPGAPKRAALPAADDIVALLKMEGSAVVEKGMGSIRTEVRNVRLCIVRTDREKEVKERQGLTKVS